MGRSAVLRNVVHQEWCKTVGVITDEAGDPVQAIKAPEIEQICHVMNFP